MLKQALDAFSVSSRSIAVEEPYASGRAELASGAVDLCYARYEGADGSDIRFMHMQSAKVDVQTLFVYPNPATDAAVFAAETVSLGRRPTILVMDMPVLSPGDTSRKVQFYLAMKSAALRHGVINTDDVPEWYQDCRTGSDVFVRPTAPEQGIAFSACLADMVNLHAHSWGGINSRACDSPAGHQAAVQAYKTHHAEHSPGVPLMTRCFGPAWAAGFMKVFFS